MKQKLLEWLSRDYKERVKRNNGFSKKMKNLLIIAYIIILILLISLMFPRGKSFEFANLTLGQPYLGPEIIAPFTFAVDKSTAQYQADLEEARRQVAPVFILNKAIADSQKRRLDNFLTTLIQLIDNARGQPEIIKNYFNANKVIVSDNEINNIIFNKNNTANDLPSPRSTPKKTPDAKLLPYGKLYTFYAEIPRIMNTLYSVGILNKKKSELPNYVTKIAVKRQDEQILEDISFYLDTEDAQDTILDSLRTVFGPDDFRTNLGYEILVVFLKPDIFYNKEETEELQHFKTANVPLADHHVLAGERIIDSHEIVTEEHIRKLDSLSKAKVKQNNDDTRLKNFLSYSGKLLITSVLFLIFVLLLWQKDYPVLTDPKKMLLICILFLLMILLGYLVNYFSFSSLLIPVAVGSMLLTIFFNAQIGFIGTVTIAFLLGALRGNEYNVTFVSLIVGTVALLSVYRVRSRNWVIRSIATLTVTYLISSTILNFLSYSTFPYFMRDWGYGIINAFLSPIFTYGLLVIFEFLFDMTTDMTLLELSDLNQPILRQLGFHAPGTYHHSLIVGSLAEGAADAIGGNSLLARVGAYYHDIGKMEKPEYFIENQQKGINPHDRLRPNMSCLILLNHVRRGLEMAEKYHLPKEIMHFIAEHHGKSVMAYFYQKASATSNGELLNETDFRYSGPRPHSRETGIVMLADAVEAASRVLKDPSPGQIRNVVEHILDERFKNGELDECPLTLADLNKISESFQKILVGIFHGRIQYPGKKVNNGSKDSKKLYTKSRARTTTVSK